MQGYSNIEALVLRFPILFKHNYYIVVCFYARCVNALEALVICKIIKDESTRIICKDIVIEALVLRFPILFQCNYHIVVGFYA